MRILHVNDVAHVATTLAAAQRLIGHEVDVRSLELVAGNRSTAVKLLALPLRLKELRSVNDQVRGGSYDIVHIHYAYLGWAGIFGRYPYVLHCHGTDLRAGLADFLRGPAVRSALKHAGVVLVGTPDLLPQARPIRPDVVFLPGPIDVAAISVEPEPPRPFRVLLHANLGDVKRSDIALEAFQRLRARMPEARLTAVDSGPARGRFQSEPGIELVPRVSHAEVPALIGRHHAVLGQFGIGSLGISELEAMAAGRPVLCHFVHPEAYGAPPPVLSSQDPILLARWLAELAGDPGRRASLGSAARSWVAENHGSVVVARQLDRVYSDNQAVKEPSWGTP